MILHIIKKDLRLLWPFVAGLTALNALVQWMRYGFSVLGNDAGWVVFGPIATIGWIILVVVLVHQDVIPGTRQDWLTRPIKRYDLAAAKLLFVVGVLHAPLFVMMAIEVLAAGYSPADAIGAAFKRSVTLFFVLSLPTFAIAAITRNLIEAVIAAIVVAVVEEIAASLLLAALTDDTCGSTCGSSLNWIAMAVRGGLIVVAALTVIGLQYFKRGATLWARAVVLLAAVAFAVVGRLSWGPAFAIQRVVTGAPDEAPLIAISLDRAQQAAPAPQGPERAAILAARKRLREEGGEPLGALLVSRTAQGVTISLPLRIDGQRARTVLWADRVEIRLLDASERVVYRGEGDELEIRAGSTGVAQTVFIPASLFSADAGTELRAELDYWLTSLEESGAATLSVSGGEVRLRNGERCSARPLRAGGAINLSCLTIHRPPPCYAASVELGSNLLVCAPSYLPDALWGNLFWRFDVNLPIAGGVRAEDAMASVVTYEPRNHFTVELDIPQLRLADWIAESPQ
jgi:hypothetical protein